MDAFRTKLIIAIQKNTGLLFIQEDLEGNLCYAHNNEELRDEFKQSFGVGDLDCYIRSFGKSTVDLPQNALEFWRRVREGKLS